MDKGGILLEKGPFFRQLYDIPISSVTAVEVKRTIPLRLLRGKKITLFTLSGKVSFYLKKNEPLAFLMKGNERVKLRPKFTTVLLGAFSETRAFNGMILFSVTLTRIGNIFGSGYYDSIVSMIDRTAENIKALLDTLHIAVPRITAAVAVFTAAAWLFAFVRNVLKLSRFTVKRSKIITICHGLITLYERMVVPDNLNAVIIRETASTLLFHAAPVYCHNIMLLPPLRNKKRSHALKALLGISLPESYHVMPPKKALFGHIALPFGWGVADLALLLLIYVFGDAPILLSLLWGGLVLCLWYCGLFAVYMRHTGLYIGSRYSTVSARSGIRLHSVILPQKYEAYRRVDRNLFQLFSGMCDVSFYAAGKVKIRIRNIYHRIVSELL